MTGAPPLERSPRGRLVAGVCRGIADHYGVDVRVVRFATMLLTAAAGAGAIAYVVAWATLPVGVPAEHPPPRPQGARTDAGESIALLLITFGALLVLRAAGMWINDTVALVTGIAAVGLTLVWGDLGGAEELGNRRPLRIAVGVLLLIIGVVALIASSGDVETLGRSLLSTGLVGVGVALLFGPYLARLSDELDAERRSRIRFEERAEIAAHLHDGVLQTLALVQKRADDPREVARLARRQERELRNWLHGTAPLADSSVDTGNTSAAGTGTVAAESAPTLVAHLGTLLADVEDDHGVRIELVTVGDRALDPPGHALAAAVREASVNAARHADVAAFDVFVEVGPEGSEAFVRDRGVGFDPASVAADRRGVAESIVGRIERAGGVASVKSSLGSGTEVELSVPHSAVLDPQDGVSELRSSRVTDGGAAR